ncbi:MAG: hypothetical protein GF398_12355 [Chitinivibrionales bacterium]|nr:hypothetical protein [Chitinivibrionales bacterium]
MHSAQEVISYLFSLTNRGIKLGLDRIRTAAARAGDPHNAFASIHIGGTNGKGSTCAFVESCLRNAGYRTGMFTSPHLVDFSERFCISGKPVSQQVWLASFRELHPIIEELRLTFFEASTLIAFDIFRRTAVDWAVIEVGLGGRLDSTNILMPRLTALTSIDYDHEHILGRSLQQIAREKLGIIKQGVPLVSYLPADSAVWSQIAEHCRHLGAPLTFAGEVISGSPCGFTYRDNVYQTHLPGTHQHRNAALALEIVNSLDLEPPPDPAGGILSAMLPGRFQRIEVDGQEYVFDVGHNPAATEMLVANIKSHFPGRSICIIAGIMKDKRKDRMAPHYAAIASTIIFTRAQIQRAELPENLRKLIPADFAGDILTAEKTGRAVELGQQSGADIICVTGSFYVVGEVMALLGAKPFG